MRDLAQAIVFIAWLAFIGLTAYFITPWALLIVLFTSFSTRSTGDENQED